MQLGLDGKNFILMLSGIGMLFVADLCKCKGIVIRENIIKQELWFQCVLFVLSVVAILTFGIWGAGYDVASFIYFQF